MNEYEQLVASHAKLIKWRAWMDEHTPFKSPNRLDCLKWAVTEIAEAIDADMHGYVRNNDHERSVEMELGDTILDLLTIYPKEYPACWIDSEWFMILSSESTLLDINYVIANAATHEDNDDMIAHALYSIMAYLGGPEQFDKALDLSMTKIHRKWMVAS